MIGNDIWTKGDPDFWIDPSTQPQQRQDDRALTRDALNNAIRSAFNSEYPELPTRCYIAIPPAHLRALEAWVRFGRPPQSPILIASLLGATDHSVPHRSDYLTKKAAGDVVKLVAWIREVAPVACWGRADRMIAWANPCTTRFERSVLRIASIVGIKDAATQVPVVEMDFVDRF